MATHDRPHATDASSAPAGPGGVLAPARAPRRPSAPAPAPEETEAFALIDGRGRIISASEGLARLLGCDVPSDRLTGRAFAAVLQDVIARPDAIEADLWLAATRHASASTRVHESGELRLRGPGANGDILILNAQAASGVRMFLRVRRRTAAPPPRRNAPAPPTPDAAAPVTDTDTPAAPQAGANPQPPGRRLPGLGPVLEGLPDAVFVTDMAGRLVTGNEACRDIFSRPLAPVIGQPIAGLLPRDLAAAMSEADAAVAETGQPLRFTRARNVALGHWREYEIVKAPLRSPEGLALGVVTTCRDVTVQDTQIRQGMEQARLLDALLTHIPYFVTWKNRDLVYQGCSQNFADIFASGSRNGVIGATDADLLTLAAEAETFRRGDTAVMTTGTPLLDVHRIVHRPDGRPMRWMISTVCLRDRSGEITGILSVARDVTAARRTEAERDRLSRIMQSLLQLPVTVFQTDDTGTITEALGETVFDGDDTKGKDVFRLLPGAAGSLRESLTRRSTVRFEVTDERRGRALDVVFGPDRPGGRGYLGVGLDVTERRRAERALRERDRLLSSIIGTIPVVLSAVERDGRIVFSEGRALSLLGGEPGAAVGKPAADVWADQPGVLEGLARAHAGEDVVIDLEVGEAALQMHIMPMDEDEEDEGPVTRGRRRGGPALILGVDITDRRRAEARFRAMFEKATVGLALLDDQGTIVTANGALCRILGEDADALAGSRAADLLPVPEPGTWRSWREVVGGRAVGAPAPPWLRIGHHAFSDDGRGREAASILMVEDSSEVRELEDQLAHLSKLTALGEMAASLAHEINQPLNTARLVAEAALEELAGSRAKSARRGEKALSTIHAQTQRIAEIIRHVRQFGRRDDDKPRPFDPVAVTRTVVKFFRHEARKAKVALNVDLPRTGPLILGHTVRFEQVLINLLRNALDAVVEAHGDSGGGRICLSIRLEDQTAVVCVTDNGTGIPDSVRDRIFEPFFTTKSGERGSGLGLAICLTIVAEMNGRIDVLKPATGASVAIRLPIPEAPAPAAPPAIPAAAIRGDDPAAGDKRSPAALLGGMARGGARRSTKALAGLTVVVADDEDEALQTVARSLRGHGMSVVTAGTGEDAFDAVVEHDPDALITDLTMPGAGGEALIERLATAAPGLPVIVMTGRPVGDEPWKRHVAAVLGKPVGLKDLRELLKDLLLTRV